MHQEKTQTVGHFGAPYLSSATVLDEEMADLKRKCQGYNIFIYVYVFLFFMFFQKGRELEIWLYHDMWIIHFQFHQNIWIFLIEIPCKHVNFFPHRRRDNLVQEKAGGGNDPGLSRRKKRNVTSWECPRETKIGTKAVVKNTWIYCGFSRLCDSIVVMSVQHLPLFKILAGCRGFAFGKF